MSEIKRVFVTGGFSEDEEFIAPLANEVGAQLFPDIPVYALTYAQAHKLGSKLTVELKDSAHIGHSGSTFLSSRGAGMMVSMAGAEPLSRLEAIKRGKLVADNKLIGREQHVPKPATTNGVKEVLKHPSHLAILGRIPSFSTVEMLTIGGHEAFPHGRFYLPAYYDEFGFGQNGEVELARRNGIAAEFVGAFHNYAMLHPVAAVVHTKQIIEANS